MKTKVTIEQDETKIILVPQNDFEQDVLQKASEKKYSLITEISYKIPNQWSNEKKYELEVLLSRRSGILDQYPLLKEKYLNQIELLRTIDSKLQSVKSTKIITEVKALLEEWGNQPLQNF